MLNFKLLIGTDEGRKEGRKERGDETFCLAVVVSFLTILLFIVYI